MPLGATTSEPTGCASPAPRVNQKAPRGASRISAICTAVSRAHCPTRDAPDETANARSGRLDVTLDVNQLHAEALRDAEDALVPIELAVDDPADPGVGDLLEAVPARAGGHVDRGAVDHHAVLGCLDDCVGFRMDRRD